MQRRNFLTALPALAAVSCARMEKRSTRYDPGECPFCSTKPGVCSYCGGTTKCTFCKGTGVRKTVTPAFEEENIRKGEYEEKCPYCGGSGTCRYCKGSGKCWACDGTGKVEDWDFYGRYQALVGKGSGAEE